MKILSHQEIEFMKNPDKFNRDYQYVLIHRIKQKRKDMIKELEFINNNERALLTDREKKEWDEREQQVKEFYLSPSSAIF